MGWELALGAVGVVLVVAYGAGWYLAGRWKRDRDWLRLIEERQREATAAMSRPVPRGGDLVDEL